MTLAYFLNHVLMLVGALLLRQMVYGGFPFRKDHEKVFLGVSETSKRRFRVLSNIILAVAIIWVIQGAFLH